MNNLERIRGWSVNADRESALSASDRLALLEEANGNRLDLPTIQEFLKITLPPKGEANREQVRDILETVGRPDNLVKLTTSLLSDPDQLDSLEAFGHSLGMDRIHLAAHNQFTLRLHFWTPKDEEYAEDPHNHGYNFGSKILSGVLTTDLFIPGSNGIPMGEYQIDSQTSKEKPKPTFITEARLETLTSPEGVVLTSHDPSYTMRHTAFHRIRKTDPDEPIITLNLRGGAVKQRTTFFRNYTMPRPNLESTNVDVEKRLILIRRNLTR